MENLKNFESFSKDEIYDRTPMDWTSRSWVKAVEKGIGGAVIDGTTAKAGDNSKLKILKIKPSIKYKIICFSNPNKPKSVAVRKLLEFLNSEKKGS